MFATSVAAALLASTYQDRLCVDTWIDQQHPAANYGADKFMFVGSGAAGLIRFPLIDQFVGQGSKVTKASITLHTAGASATSRWTASPINQPWIEGGGRGLTATDAASKAWATWNNPQPGSLWDSGSPAPLTVSAAGDTLTISGLETLVQGWIDNPASNFGIKLECSDGSTIPTEESQSSDRPALNVEFTPGTVTERVALAEPQSNSWHVVVANSGTADAPAATLSWASSAGQNGTSNLPAVPAGKTADVTFAAPTDQLLTLKVGEATLTVNPKDRPLAISGEYLVWQDQVRFDNDWALPHSRSLHFPDGSTSRFRLVAGTGDGAQPSLKSILASLAKPPIQTPEPLAPAFVADTRDDGLSDSSTPLPQFGWEVNQEIAQLLPNLGNLAPAEVSLLDTGKDPHNPAQILIRLQDANGNPIGKAHVSITGGGKTVEIDTTAGVLFLAPQLFPTRQNPVTTFTVTKGGLSESSLLTVWDTWREGLRASGPISTVERRFMLPAQELNETEDLALNRIVTDLAKSRPAQLNSVVDGDDTTALTMDSQAGPAWVEVDIGQDHHIGKVDITFTGAVPNNFGLSLDQTGGAEGGAQSWYQERYGQYQSAIRGKVAGNLTTLSYCGKPTIGRYVRFTLGPNQKAQIAAIKVYRLKND